MAIRLPPISNPATRGLIRVWDGRMAAGKSAVSQSKKKLLERAGKEIRSSQDHYLRKWMQNPRNFWASIYSTAQPSVQAARQTTAANQLLGRLAAQVVRKTTTQPVGQVVRKTTAKPSAKAARRRTAKPSAKAARQTTAQSVAQPWEDLQGRSNLQHALIELRKELRSNPHNFLESKEFQDLFTNAGRGAVLNTTAQVVRKVTAPPVGQVSDLQGRLRRLHSIAGEINPNVVPGGHTTMPHLRTKNRARVMMKDPGSAYNDATKRYVSIEWNPRTASVVARMGRGRKPAKMIPLNPGIQYRVKGGVQFKDLPGLYAKNKDETMLSYRTIEQLKEGKTITRYSKKGRPTYYLEQEGDKVVLVRTRGGKKTRTDIVLDPNNPKNLQMRPKRMGRAEYEYRVMRSRERARRRAERG